MMEIAKLYRSAGHIYWGHYGRPPGVHPSEEVPEAQIEAGRGIVGDRYFARPAGHKGQVTFFSEEVWLRLGATLGVADRGPGVFRRNVIVRGADLFSLIGQRFELQGLWFEGAEYCKPCFWMDQAFAPGALQALQEWNGGGLRARALSTGVLRA
jgi:MOSC domain-containing protein YiiM